MHRTLRARARAFHDALGPWSADHHGVTTFNAGDFLDGD